MTRLRYSLFSAAVIISEAEQPDFEELGQQAPLRRLPSLFRDERQLPSGPGTPPPAQPFLDGMEPDLPATQQPEPDPAMQEELSQLVTGLGNKLRARSEEHTSELQSLMRISYAVFCLKKKKNTQPTTTHNTKKNQS